MDPIAQLPTGKTPAIPNGQSVADFLVLIAVTDDVPTVFNV